ncbi:RNA transcription, translation and transport factor protein-like [Haliotis rufescens]|uniref:RNA transcription, translation and transport factor protein-like n=1 Tax=Haliotis rufescens TaxID=6454 RepID=UPI00201FA5DC|nr:RNA transcription, translation and transport factor protein-like [Haliotis rufescens]
MFRRKLHALDCQNAEKFNVNDENEFRNMILWLEDQKVRHHKIEDRGALRNIHSPDWEKAFEIYLKELNCPYKCGEKCAVMDWLLGFAVRLEYGDDGEKYRNVTPESVQMSRTGVAGSSSNPLDSLNFDDPDFKAGVASLALMMQVPPHRDHLEQLKAICILVKERLSKTSVESLTSANNSKNELIPLDKTELGFEAGDYIMTEAAKILRLMHIKDLRDLQTQINSAIVAVQAITANPKTDSRLGKVGR